MFPLYSGLSVELSFDKTTLCIEHEKSVFMIQKAVRSFCGCSTELPSYETNS